MAIKYRLKNTGLDWVETSDETVVLDHASEHYLKVNPAGSVLWTGLKDGATEDDLVRLLVEAFEIDQDQAATDVAAFLADLRERNLIEEAG